MMKNYVIFNNNATNYCSNTLLGRKLASCKSHLPLLSLMHNNRRFYSSSSEFQLFDDYKDITSETINKLLINQQVSISLEEFSKIKYLPVVWFDLPISDQIYSSFAALVGRSNSKGGGRGIASGQNKFCSFFLLAQASLRRKIASEQNQVKNRKLSI